jgi:hypothetical protein
MLGVIKGIVSAIVGYFLVHFFCFAVKRKFKHSNGYANNKSLATCMG